MQALTPAEPRAVMLARRWNRWGCSQGLTDAYGERVVLDGVDLSRSEAIDARRRACIAWMSQSGMKDPREERYEQYVGGFTVDLDGDSRAQISFDRLKSNPTGATEVTRTTLVLADAVRGGESRWVVAEELESSLPGDDATTRQR